MSNKRFLVWFVILPALLHGCRDLNVPLAWTAWRYEIGGAEKVNPGRVPERTESNSDYFVGQFFVNAFVRAHDETTQGGGPPYAIFVSATGTSIESEVTIHSLSIRSSLRRSYVSYPISTLPNGEKDTEMEFPLSEALRPVSAISDRYWATLRTDDNLDFAPDQGEAITVDIDVEIVASEWAERRIVTYVFYPRQESGDVGRIDPT